ICIPSTSPLFPYTTLFRSSIRKILGVEKDVKYVPFIKFFDEKGNYKLSPYLDEAYEARTPNSFQKDFIEANKRVVLLNSALSGKSEEHTSELQSRENLVCR